ncbi:uncharacterized protein Ecym_6314 [Eremothecium cymbalariae DBVPG|uniref:Uncharacterized protein n=1 Tax=Eremothecium cymbalariae (strain CBS 270.75 / DBVPG 7215 / KCTC 17166 / NRRL Y-17582) TaxID=931890 RepID=G8JUB2_ERECY|nr:hypothetical protein Ecym_6314 [Eremothecium cymbalariae DBVPG\
MQVWNLSRLFNNISYFNKQSSEQRNDGFHDYSIISDRINTDGYVEIQLATTTDLHPTNADSTRSHFTATLPYTENSDEVDVPISDFIRFRNKLQASSNKSPSSLKTTNMPPSSKLGKICARKSARDQLIARKLVFLSAAPYPNSNLCKLHTQDYSHLDRMLESTDDIQFNDKNNRRSKFIVRRGWNKKNQ